MKKMVLAAGLALALTTSIWSCGRIGGNMTEVKVTDPISYKEFTPKEKVVEGNATAKQTISAIVGKDVTVGEDYPKDSGLTEIPVEDTQTGEKYTCYEIEDYGQEKNIQFLFLYDDDTKGALAEKSSIEYVEDSEKETKLSMDFKDNAVDSVYAYTCSDARAIFMDGKTATSVWSYNPKTTEINLIWCEIASPVWANYFN